MPKTIWYSITEEMKIVDREEVDLPAALEVARRYRKDLKASYETGEQALAEGLFGFSRANDYFLEITLSSQEDAWIRTELREGATGWFARIFKPCIQLEFAVKRWRTIEEVIHAFFDHDLHGFETRLRSIKREA